MRGGAESLRDGTRRGQQAAVPDHVRHRGVVEGDPQRHEQHPGAVLHTLSDRAGNQCDGNHRESGLECHINAARIIPGRVGGGEHAVLGDHGVLEQEAGGRIAEDPADILACVSDRPAPERPNDCGDRNRGRRQHQHVQDGLRADHAAVEERHTRRHQEDQSRGCQHPRCISGVHTLPPSPAPALDEAGGRANHSLVIPMWELTRLWNARRVFETLRNVTPTLQRLYNYPRLVPNSALRGEPWTGIPAEFDDHIVGIVRRRATGGGATGRASLLLGGGGLLRRCASGLGFSFAGDTGLIGVLTLGEHARLEISVGGDQAVFR